MSTILLTGATGQVGSQLAPLLQRRGHRVLYLIRAKDQPQADSRLRGILPQVRKNDIAIAGDITQPLGGIEQSWIREWRGCVDKIIHCAASIKFDKEAANEIWEVNFGGTWNILDLAKALDITEFNYVSTAYVAGNSSRFTEEDRDKRQILRNPYEESKLGAEKLVANSNIAYNILRMSIVVGDSKTGFTRTFDGYYGFFKGLWRMKHDLHKQWIKNEDRLRNIGVQFDEQGNLELPISINCSPISTLNIVTSDWLSDMSVKLIEIPAANQTFHLTHPDPPRVQWVIETSLKHLGIKGVRFKEPDVVANYPMLKVIQRRVEKNIGKFQPYIEHGPELTCRNTIKLPWYYPPPEITPELLELLLEFAIQSDFETR